MSVVTGYRPLKITGMATGLVQEREEFILPDDAYPILENAFVWRERIKRKEGYRLLGRLRRVLTALSLGNTAGAVTTYTFNTIFTSFVPPVGAGETNKEIEPGSLVITIGPPDSATFTDNGDGTFTVTGVGVSAGSSVNYSTGVVTIVLSAAIGGAAITANINYFPGLPAMGLRTRQLTSINNEEMIAFDTKYAYHFVGTGFEEFLPGTTWTGTDFNFFWTTNYWVDTNNVNIFWATNFSGTGGDPIRYTNGVPATNWIDFAPQINAAGDRLTQCLALLPFRGRLVAFNTLEGALLATSVAHTNRIRWAAIGNPFADVSAIVTVVNPNAWRDDIRGQGGFLDIPTSEAIIAVGFVRDNLVIYCESSTWQLRYTGRSIAPFQIEKVNTELGAESTFSAVQFDTSLVGIGDKGVVECDSFKSDRIDIKIPDLVFEFNNDANGPKRVHGIRDFQQRLAYWTYPYPPDSGPSNVYPNRRLVYNYENDSWGIFTDSFTCLGTFQALTSLRWVDVPRAWQTLNFPWINSPALFPSIVGGNQQGFVEYLGSNLQPQVSNDVSLSITAITGNTTTSTVITSPNHNLETGQVIQISNIPTGTPFSTSLNGKIFGVVVTSINQFELWIYSSATGQFTTPQLDAPAAYIGGGKIAIRDNFRIVSKKFNAIDEGQKIQLGYVDVLMDNTYNGAITMNIYMDYNDSTPTNQEPENNLITSNLPDTFFNSVVPTTSNALQGIQGNKNWQRVFCATRAQFITIEWTLSNAQMVGDEQQNDVQIDAQILWMRSAGRLI